MPNSSNTLNSDYYQLHAEEFFEQTVALKMEKLYRLFLKSVPENGKILDAGCGSGRDAKYFFEHGYKITAFDSSHALAELASNHLDQKVEVLSFQELDFEAEYDGIWACASLLHVPAKGMKEVFHGLYRALKTKGVLYASFKYGRGEHNRNGRRFTDMDEVELDRLLDSVTGFKEIKTWVSIDLRPGRENEKWLNTLLRKEGN